MTAAQQLAPPAVPPSLETVSALNRRLGAAVQRMVARYVAEIPFYRQLPEEELWSDVAVVARDMLVLFVRTCREGRLPNKADMAPARAGAARRAAEGVPLDDLLMAYCVGNRVTWEMLAELVPAGSERQIVGFTPYLQQWLQVMLDSVAEAYQEERRFIEHADGSLWHALVQSVLDGAPSRELAERLGVPLAPSYLALALHVDPVADETSDGVNADIAGRRKVRRMQAVVDGVDAGDGAGPALASLTADGGVVLLPGRTGRLPGRAAVSRHVTMLGRAASVPVIAVAVSAADPAGVPAAVVLARQLLVSARALGRPAGTYLLEDLALEHQVSVDGPARRHLAEQVRPLLTHPDLLPTLRCWLDRERNRKEVAEELHIHPNTLDKRLHRIGQLTGIDGSTTRGLALLHGALVALDVELHLEAQAEPAAG